MAAPAEVPPPIFAAADSISVFLIYAPPPFRYAAEVLYIGVFRSRPSSGALDGRLTMLEEAEPLGGAARGGATPPMGFWPSGLRLLDFKASYHHSSQNIDPRKSPGPFDSV